MHASITRRIVSPVKKRQLAHARARVHNRLTRFQGKAGETYQEARLRGPRTAGGAPSTFILPTMLSSRKAAPASDVSMQT